MKLCVEGEQRRRRRYRLPPVPAKERRDRGRSGVPRGYTDSAVAGSTKYHYARSARSTRPVGNESQLSLDGHRFTTSRRVGSTTSRKSVQRPVLAECDEEDALRGRRSPSPATSNDTHHRASPRPSGVIASSSWAEADGFLLRNRLSRPRADRVEAAEWLVPRRAPVVRRVRGEAGDERVHVLAFPGTSIRVDPPVELVERHVRRRLRPPVARSRSCGESSSWSPRRPPLTTIVSCASADSSTRTGRLRRLPSTDVPPRT